MPTLAPLTELDAVNDMLLSIGQAPVNSLDVAGIRDVAIAQTTLHNISREVQSSGWWFNTDTKYPFAFDGDGKIAIPADVLHMDPVDPHLDFVARMDAAVSARRLWDKEHHTFVLSDHHTGPIEFNVVWFQAFDGIPQTARNYITQRAGRRFQQNVVGAQILDRYEERDEYLALAEMRRENLRSRDMNILRQHPSAAIYHRHRNPR